MKVVMLEFNKSSTQTLDEFSNIIQKLINDNNDLLEFRPYENQHTGAVKIELLFGLNKTKVSEIMSYGPGLAQDLLEQLNGTLAVASNQAKNVKYVGLTPMAKSPRSIGFLVLEKRADSERIVQSGKDPENKENTQNTATDARSATRRARAK